MNSVKFGFLLFALFLNSIATSYGDEGDYKEVPNAAVAVIDFARRESRPLAEYVKISQKGFQKAAIVSMLNLGWEVSKIADNEVNGVIKDNYKVRVVMSDDNRIKIYVTGPTVRESWAENLRRHMRSTLVLLSE